MRWSFTLVKMLTAIQKTSAQHNIFKKQHPNLIEKLKINQVTWVCLKPERKRTLKLQTFYLYGLNEKGSLGNKSSNTDEVVVRKIFPSPSRNGRREVIQLRYTIMVEAHQVS